MNPNPHHDDFDRFDDIINNGIHMNSGYQKPEYTDPSPYGIPANSIPVKTGLTTRGKVAVAIGVTVLAGSGLLSWQHYTAVSAANQAKAQELQIQKAKIDLETLKEMNRVNTSRAKTQSAQDTARQKQIDACVNTNKGLVGKQLGATYRSVLEDCQTQYQAATSSADMQAAASSQDTNSSGGHVNEGLLIGGGVLVGGIYLVARKSRTSHPA